MSTRANSIAVLGPRGWVAGEVIHMLSKTASEVTAVYRKGSSPGDLPSNVKAVEVDWEDEASILRATKGADIVMSLVGQQGLAAQLTLVPILAKAGTKLFIPSDFAYKHTKEDDDIPVIRNKEILEQSLHKAGVPTLNILSGNFAEFALNTPRIGVDIINNRIVHTGQTDVRRINLCTRAYVATALATLLPTTPIDSLAGRTIGLNEFRPNGAEIEQAMAHKFSAHPQVARSTDERSLAVMASGSPWALAESVKLKWSRGEHSIGDDIYEVEGYKKIGLDELLAGGQLIKYRQLPFDYGTVLDEYFQ